MKTSLSLKVLAISVLVSLIYESTANAQTNTFPATGKVGIGTVTPVSQLEIVAPAISSAEKLMKFSVSDAVNDYLDITNVTGAPSVFIPGIRGNVTSSPSISLMFIGQTDTANDTGINPVTVFDSRFAGSKIAIRPLFAWTSYDVRYMTMLADGNLGIGTSTPTEKLSVKGKIRAQEIKVETANWPDYVFAKNYELLSLKETEKHIHQKGHLPGIPSAEEVKANGVDLGEMNAKLLKKIEELTLYLIEKDKTEKRQQTQIDELKALVTKVLAKQK